MSLVSEVHYSIVLLIMLCLTHRKFDLQEQLLTADMESCVNIQNNI